MWLISALCIASLTVVSVIFLILIIPILCVAGTPLADAWLSVSLHIHMRGRRLNGDVGLRRVATFVYSSLLHCCDIWYSCMCGSRRRVLHQLIDDPSNDIPHTVVPRVIAVCATAGRRRSATLEPVQLSQLWILPVSLSVTSYTVERRREHGVSST